MLNFLTINYSAWTEHSRYILFAIPQVYTKFCWKKVELLQKIRKNARYHFMDYHFMIQWRKWLNNDCGYLGVSWMTHPHKSNREKRAPFNRAFHGSKRNNIMVLACISANGEVLISLVCLRCCIFIICIYICSFLKSVDWKSLDFF